MLLLRSTPALLLATLLAPLAAVALPSAAQAHTALTSATPADGARLTEVPTEVTLTFSEEVREPAFVVVTAPDGSTHEAGRPGIDGPTVSQEVDRDSLDATRTAGTWTVAYRVVSADGHPVQGVTSFEVSGSPSATPTSDSSGTPASTPSAAPETADTEETSSDEAGSTAGAPIFVASLLAALLVAVAAVTVRRKREGGRR